MSYIIELERGVWIAPWDGDPGRTLIRENAHTFRTRAAAERALQSYKNAGYNVPRVARVISSEFYGASTTPAPAGNPSAEAGTP